MTNAEISKQIYDSARLNGMPAKLAGLIVAQSKHESANYSSSVFKANNNPFGYKFVGQNIAVKGSPAPGSEGSNMFYAKYANVGDAAKEICSWIKRRQGEHKFPADLGSVSTAETYAALLKASGYFTDGLSNYLAGLKRWAVGDLSVKAVAGISTAAVIAAAAVAIVVLKKK